MSRSTVRAALVTGFLALGAMVLGAGSAGAGLSASLSYNGKDADKVGSGYNAGPDGTPDGHFTIVLTTDKARTVGALELSQGSGVWDTLPQGSFAVLGVFRNGQRLNPKDEGIKDPVSGKVTYEVYASDYGYFADVSKFVAKITFTDGSVITSSAAGNATTTTIAPVATLPPAPTEKPSTRGKLQLTGVPEVGRTLGVFLTTQWEPQNRLSVRFQWRRCRKGCADIPGATGVAYQLQAADLNARLRVEEIASNAKGETILTSDQTDPIRAAVTEPRYSKLPSISGEASVGKSLQGTPGEWVGTEPIGYSYQWQRCTDEGLCSEIAGANRPEYRVTAAEEAQRLQLKVVARNGVTAVYALSAKTDRIAPDQSAVIKQSYAIAFGRAPGADELKSWLAQGKLTRQQLIAHHLRSIGANATLAGQVVDAAYLLVYGHAHNSLQSGQFQRDSLAEAHSPKTYDDLVDQYAAELAHQAYDHIFFWDSKLQHHAVDEWVAKVKAGAFGGSTPSKGEQLWTAIALSNDPIHGAARTTYNTGAAGSANREGCFGGIGPGCQGAIDPPQVVGDGDVSFAPFVTKDGRLMKYIRLKTAVGSIVHDSTCRVNVGGAWCKLDFGNFGQAETPILKYFKAATEEWNKAVADTLEGRKWDEIFGPYPDHDIKPLLDGKHAADIQYSDDLRTVAKQTRYTEVQKGGLVFGLFDFTSPHKWGGIELRAESRLQAPAGTTLDGSDKDYCAAGRFAKKAKDYGVCG